MATAYALQLTLADIARLAQVQRPVVSMWRRRPLPGTPFPEPVALHAGQPRFDAIEIADYLATTSRGNARIDRADVAAHATPTGTGDLTQDVVFDGLTALLALAALTGAPLEDLDSARLRALATETDPDDTLLLREVVALGTHAARLAAHAVALADASYSTPAAFEVLLRQATARGLSGRTALALDPAALDLVARVVTALALDATGEVPLLVDPTDGSGDLLLAAAQHTPDLTSSVATLARDTTGARLLRRRLAVRDLHAVYAAAAADDVSDLDPALLGAGVLHLLQLPTLDQPAMTDAQVLDAIDNLAVQLTGGARVIVLGPASALTDRPATAEVDRARDAVLRGGRLRVAVRLPAGLLVHAPRQHLALWVLGPAPVDVPIAQRWTVTADLSDSELTPGVLDGLVTDVVASMASPRAVAGHSFRFARRVVTSTLIAGRIAVVHNATRAARVRDAVTRALGDLVAARMCRVIPGNRIDPADLREQGRRVVGPEELCGILPTGARAVDPLTFPAGYAAARYTEAGDVVFCTSPHPAAWVDREGGSVVLAPARAIRITADPEHGIPPLAPEVIAADIAASAPGKAWRRWPIRLVPRERHTALTATLAEIAGERARLETALADLTAREQRVMETATRPEPEGP